MKENPFDDKDIPLATARPDDLSGIVRRIAAIEDELDRRGADPLIKEKDTLRKTLKEQMLSANRDKIFDEVSEWEAVITNRSKDVWDIDRLEQFLTQSQLRRYVKKMVDESAVKEGIKVGDLSRPTLERQGVVKKQPGVKALYVRKRQET